MRAQREDRAPAASSARQPLEGLIVLDFSQFLAGPSCALRLADLGADVIKIERPSGGDACRQLFIADQSLDGTSALFHTINRNKRSFAADLKNPQDLARVKALIAQADVMIHNFRPGVMERLGLGFDVLETANPRLIYAAITGFGSDGPWRDKPGQDLLVQALSGITWLSGNGSQGPVPVGMSITDMAAGAHLCQGILAMLVRRAATGRGGRVEISLFESAVDLQFEQFSAFLNSQRIQPTRGEIAGANVYLGAPYGVYATADGHIALAMVAIPRLRQLLGCDELAAYDDPATWFRDRDAIKAIIATHLMKNDTAHWLRLLDPADVWAAQVLDWPSLLQQDGYAALQLTQEVRNSQGNEMLTTRCPIRIDGSILGSSRGAPLLGADTEEIIRAFNLTGGGADI